MNLHYQRFTSLVAWLLSVFLLLPALSQAAPPPGQSALLNGMHDIEASSWLKSATTGCDKGWLTDLRYIGHSGTPGVSCHRGETNAGISIIQRLDVSGSESYPRDPSNAVGFAKNFAHYAKQCANIHVWIVGNEPNFTEHKSDPNCTSAAYATAYVAVHKALHALPGHQNDVVLVASNSPYSPGCVESLRQITKQIQQRGVQPDGFALHAYTRAARGSDLTASHVTSTKTQRDQTRKECTGNASWDDTWHSHFRIYIDYIKAIEGLGLAGRPVYITESGNACEPTIGKNQCYPDADVGYFQALYSEANRWNQQANTKTKIRAITPYRWTRNQDGTDRDFAIGARPKLLRDLTKAFAQKYNWTNSKCGNPGCQSNVDCPSGQTCTNGACVTKPPQSCRDNTGCNGLLCSPGSCQDRPGQCIPQGSATWSLTPQAPTPGAASVTAVATHATGWTHIGLRYCGPTSGEGNFIKHEKIDKLHNWSFQFGPVQAGLYRIDFTADKGATIVGSTTLFVGAACTPQPESCNNKDDDCDGSIDNGVTRPCYEGPAGTERQGTCHQGTITCQAGQWGACQEQSLPALERCDGKDNDCDGQIDNNCTGASEPTPQDVAPTPDAAPPRPHPDLRAVDVLTLTPDRSITPPRKRGCSCHATKTPTALFWGLILFALLCYSPRKSQAQPAPTSKESD